MKKGQSYSYDESLDKAPDLRNTQSETYSSSEYLTPESVFYDSNHNVISPLQKVQAASDFPYTLIGKITSFEFPNRIEKSVSTGIAIDKKTIMTCAHGVMNHQVNPMRPYSHNIFHLTYKNQELKFLVEKIHFRQEFLKIKGSQKYHYDYAFLILKNQLPFEPQDFLQIARDYNGRDSPIIISGYSKVQDDKMESCQYQSRGYIQNIQNGFIQYLQSTQEGASGAPVLVEKDQKFYIIGIHILGNKKAKNNSAIHLTENLVKIFNEWNLKPFKNSIKLKSSAIVHSVGIQNYKTEEYACVQLKEEANQSKKTMMSSIK